MYVAGMDACVITKFVGFQREDLNAAVVSLHTSYSAAMLCLLETTYCT